MLHYNTSILLIDESKHFPYIDAIPLSFKLPGEYRRIRYNNAAVPSAATIIIPFKSSADRENLYFVEKKKRNASPPDRV